VRPDKRTEISTFFGKWKPPESSLMIVTDHIIAAAQIDPSYSPGGASVHPHINVHLTHDTWFLWPACKLLPRSVQPLVAGITVVTNTQTTPLRLGNRPQCVMRLTITYIHPFNGPFSGTTRVGRYQKGKTNLDFTEARDSEWQ